MRTLTCLKSTSRFENGQLEKAGCFFSSCIILTLLLKDDHLICLTFGRAFKF
ncbi:hypothetical protein B4092_2412 [Bacillus licheniformis]|nr:hypothetical protein B4092_2412 [Bacillus licheniformis]OLF93129.1 hypothetical protein B4089_2101 [Bacillus licheniformis]OLF96903.1 hypothetical protein B4089_0504 [Bacillus licheniformis]TWL92695.1 hypothetical protein CHCC15292_2996 [Bacillus licheniformis]TWN51849.1 hypothetical protein CHCC14437_0098 [Bacillus licheniformis]